jgi:hypothetical protein
MVREIKMSFGLTQDQKERFRTWATALPESRLIDRPRFEFFFITTSNNHTSISVVCHASKKSLNLGAMEETGTYKISETPLKKSSVEVFNTLINSFPSASYTFSFSPSEIGVATVFSINITDYTAW